MMGPTSLEYHYLCILFAAFGRYGDSLRQRRVFHMRLYCTIPSKSSSKNKNFDQCLFVNFQFFCSAHEISKTLIPNT